MKNAISLGCSEIDRAKTRVDTDGAKTNISIEITRIIDNDRSREAKNNLEIIAREK